MSNVVSESAEKCAETIPSAPGSFAEDRAALAPHLDALIGALRQSDERFAFDSEGRPSAIAAVREALPANEAELLAAILDDVACELAAYQEALYRIAVAARRR